MKIGKDTVVLLTYRLSNDAGEVLEDAMENDPVALLYGHGNVIRGLERGLAGHSAGDQFELIVDPLDGYGPHQPEQIRRLSKKYFDNPKRLKPGMQTTLKTDDGTRQVTVIKVGGKVVDVDLNHPLAGERLHFVVNVVEVRGATASELAHGHAHAGGHDHH
jgi:FKBP-type peptidyl-prolyl cis-trans isomerase SlyD